MSWCLDCHRNPEKYVRPREEVFNMAWQRPADDPDLGVRLVKDYKIASVEQLGLGFVVSRTRSQGTSLSGLRERDVGLNLNLGAGAATRSSYPPGTGF